MIRSSLIFKSVYLCQRTPSANSWRAFSGRIKRDVSWPNISQKRIVSLPILHPSSVLQSAGTLQPSWQRCSEYLSEVRNVRVCSFTDEDDNDEMFHVSCLQKRPWGPRNKLKPKTATKSTSSTLKRSSLSWWVVTMETDAQIQWHFTLLKCFFSWRTVYTSEQEW